MAEETVDVKFGADASEAVDETKRFGNALEETLGKAGGSMNLAGTMAVAFGSVIASVMEETAKQIAKMVEKAVFAYADLGDAVEKAQRRIGNSIEYVSGMKVALDSVGLSMEQFQRVAQRMPQILETHGEKLKEAGVSYLDMNGQMLDSTTIMMNISQHLEQYAAGAERNAEGNRLLGRSYKEMADFVELTAQRQAEATAVAERFGLVLSEKDAEATNEFSRQLQLLKAALEGFFVTLGKMLTPALTELAELLRYLLVPVFEVFRAVLLAVMTLVEGFELGVKILAAGLVALASPLELVAKLFSALWIGMTEGPAAGLAAVNEAVGEYKARIGGLLEWVVSETEKTNARVANMVNRPKAGGPDGAQGDDPAKKDGADPVSAAKAHAQLAVVKETLAEEMAAIRDAHKAQELEISEFYDRKLNIIMRGLQAEKERLAVDIAGNAAEKDRADTREKAAQIEAKGILLKNQSLIIDMKLKDATIANERERTEALTQENAKRTDIEERAQMKSLATQQGIARDALAFQRNMGQISASEELTALAALENAKYAAARESMERRLAVQREGTLKYREIQAQINGLDEEHERNAVKAEENITMAQTRELRQRTTMAAESYAHLSKIELGILMDTASANRAMGMITAEEELAVARRVAQEKFDLEIQLLREKQALYDANSTEYAAMNDRIAALAAAHARELNRLQLAQQAQQQRDYKTLYDGMSRDFQTTLSHMMQGSMTWQKGLQAMWKSLQKNFSDFVSKQVTDWLQGQISMTNIQKAWSAIRQLIYPAEAEVETASKTTAVAATTALNETATATAISTKATEATAIVSSNAAEAGSGAAASVSSIPFAGWLMAAGVFAAVLAMVMGAKSNIKSAEGGYDIPSGINPMVQAHEEEMMLPKEHANTIRRLGEMELSGGGGSVSLSVTAVDAKSVEKLFRRNGVGLTNALRKQARNFRRM